MPALHVHRARSWAKQGINKGGTCALFIIIIIIIIVIRNTIIMRFASRGVLGQHLIAVQGLEIMFDKFDTLKLHRINSVVCS